MPPAKKSSAKKPTGKTRTGAASDFSRDFEKAYGEALRELGKFNLAIFGKTGVGKSTLINAIFGDEVALTGTGRPVTRGTHYYEHPSGYFGVYDSEGVEVGQEGDEILAKFREIIEQSRSEPVEKHIHVIWYCVRAADLRFEDTQAEFVQALAEEGVPVLVVLTQVETNGAGEIHPETLKLAHDIEERRLPLSPTNRVFFTMAKADEWSGRGAHGLQELLDATFLVAPDAVASALTAAQKIDFKIKARHARTYVAAATTAASAAGATPIPFADAAVLVPIQVAMMAKISAIHGLNVRTGTLATLAGAAFTTGGVTAIGKYMATSLLKAIPGGNVAGGVIRAGVAGSLTAAVGAAWIAVCQQLLNLDPAAIDAIPTDEIKKLFMAEFKNATKSLKKT